MNNKKIIICIILSSLIVVIFHFYLKEQPDESESKGLFDFFRRPKVWKGRVAPDFEIKLINGEEFKLSENIGKKVIILNFFATWCSACIEEMPELNRFYKKHKQEPFLMIGIDDNENREKVNDFIEKYMVSFPIAIDNGDIKQLFTVRGLPTTILIGAKGRVLIYDTGSIHNADIAFDSIYNQNIALIKQGKGISKDVYLSLLKKQEENDPITDHIDVEKEDKSIELTGRASVIAEKMNCPCGCSNKVMECSCKTAKNIKEELKSMELSSAKDDTEIIKELNKKFCK